MEYEADLNAKIDEFNAGHRWPDFRVNHASARFNLQTWDFSSPCTDSDKPGVYVFLNADGGVLRVGKASCGNKIGARVCSHKESGLPEEVVYLITIPFPEKFAFEGPALEEYLIRELKPALNKQGRTEG